MTLKIEALLPVADVEKYFDECLTDESQNLLEAIFDKYGPIIERYAIDLEPKLGPEYTAMLPSAFVTTLLLVELILQEGAERPN